MWRADKEKELPDDSLLPKLRAGFVALSNQLTERTQNSNYVLEDNERLRKKVDTLTKQNQELLLEYDHVTSEVITLKQENKDLASRIEVLVHGNNESDVESNALSSTISKSGMQ
jgi:uncharacterized coiled-coil DUF342 family protein